MTSAFAQSVRTELVEVLPSCNTALEREGFDKLSPNGILK